MYFTENNTDVRFCLIAQKQVRKFVYPESSLGTANIAQIQ